jgi:hypothetical protein
MFILKLWMKGKAIRGEYLRRLLVSGLELKN